MPQTHNELSKDVRTRLLEPPNKYQAAAAGLPTRMGHAHWSMHGPDCLTIYGSREKAGTEAGSLFDPVAGHTGRHEGAARRPTQRRRNSVRTAADAGGRTRAVPAMRVLVVEDDAIIGTLLAEMLAGMGHDVCGIEATEADAVGAAARCKPDLMIVDVSLGEGSGVAAVEAIHRAGPVPHVFVSGDISKFRALPAGSIFIRKPYRESNLARVIQQALDRASIQ